MKIGILTYHRALNYGAVLQAYAMYHVLKKKGHQVEIVDYCPYEQSIFYSINPFCVFKRKDYGISKKISELFLGILSLPIKYGRKRKFNKFLNKYFLIGYGAKYLTCHDIPDTCDLYIYGSDQIWWYDDFLSFMGFSEVYWGNFPISKSRKITYAASMGHIGLDKNKNIYIKKNILNFNAVSVREKKLKLALNELTHINIEEVLDPVFLLSKNEWKKQFQLKKNNKKYVLLYDFHKSQNALEIARKIAQEKNISLIKITRNNFPLYKNPTIENFLELFYNAEYIITTSFHGLAFAINFKKDFYTIKVSKSEDRIMNLLQLTSLEDRHLKDKHFSLEEINFKKVDKIIKSCKLKSLNFLLKQLF